jgi:hypothetical protein
MPSMLHAPCSMLGSQADARKHQLWPVSLAQP